MSDALLKRCTKCGEEKPATTEYFYVRKERKVGLTSWCSLCNSARHRQYRVNNAEKRRESSRRYYANNAEKVRENSRRYYANNAEKTLERQRKHSAENPAIDRAYKHRRRERKRGNGGAHTAADIRLLLKSQNRKCWWCGKKIKANGYHVDHRIPLSRGGSNAPENLCIACPTCNLSKGNKLPQEWIGRLL